VVVTYLITMHDASTDRAERQLVPSGGNPGRDETRRTSAQSLGEGGEHGPIRPIHARTRVGAAQDGHLVAQHEEFDVLGGGRSGHQ